MTRCDHVFVVMGNDFPDAVFRHERDARDYCDAKKAADRITNQRPTIHWRWYEFNLRHRSTSMITEILNALTPSLRQQVGAYIVAHRLEPEHLLRVDIVLALLRINTTEALGAAEKLTGKPITKCPPCLPPWPPAPVRAPTGPVVARVTRNPCLPTTEAFQRFRLVKPGLTRQQLLVRGVTVRDLRKWTRAGYVGFAP